MTDAKYRRVADEIVDKIRSGELKPGDPVPSIRALEKEHGNSTAVAAHRWLREQGWVVPTPGAGTKVAPTPGSAAPDQRIADLESQLAELQERHDADSAELRAQVAALQVALTELYGKTGHAYPSAAPKRSRRSAAS